MKSVMLSIKPEYCELIANGKKTIEVRKTRPKIEPPFKCYIYCTKATSVLDEFYCLPEEQDLPWGEMGNQKVIGEFVCNKILAVDCDSYAPFSKETGYYVDTLCCLDRHAFWEYTHGRCAFGWHISDLKIYDAPMPLNGFKCMCKYMDRDCFACPYYDYTSMDCVGRKITRPPQSWCYVEELK